MGKSALASTVASGGVPVVDTDLIAREIVEPGQPALGEIAAAFGSTMLRPDGSLERGKLASVVFADPVARATLEGILHPRIRSRWESWLADLDRGGRSAAVVVIPLLFETGAESRFDAVVCVACSGETQRTRLRARGWTDAEIDRRNAAQMPVAEKMRRARFVVWTEPPLRETERQWACIARTLGITWPT